jgi:putative tryptophan/tyrosine transport system substrate-binding protein
MSCSRHSHWSDEEHVKRRKFVTLIGGAVAWPFAARAQRAGKIFRVGCAYVAEPASFQPLQEAFVPALHDLGYVEGQNIVYDTRYAEDDPTRLPVLIDELISLT